LLGLDFTFSFFFCFFSLPGFGLCWDLIIADWYTGFGVSHYNCHWHGMGCSYFVYDIAYVDTIMMAAWEIHPTRGIHSIENTNFIQKHTRNETLDQLAHLMNIPIRFLTDIRQAR
jgi:hypothetical protein